MDAETVGTNTLRVMQALGARQDNGSLYFDDLTKFDDYGNWLSAARIPADFIPCSISMIDSVTRKDKMPSLVMMINPKDFTVSQSFVSNSANTRKGWINTLWGNQQATISASGMTAGFYYVYANGFGGISNFSRKNSVSFFNLLAIMTLFKNNGYYYMDGQENPTLFSNVGSSLSKSADFRNMYDYVGNSLGAGSDFITTGTYNRANESSSTSLGGSRVINVMDIIKISYDGSDYIGNFTTFSLSDVADNPYRMEYNFEFSVSIFGSDPNSIDGHIEMNNNSGSDKIVVAIQGRNTHFDETVGMDETELKNNFPPEKAPEKEYFLDPTNPINKDYKSTASTKMKISNIPNAYRADILSAVDVVNKTAKYKVDPNMIAGIISQESVGDQYAVSSAGAKGLMQLTDSTARDMGVTSAFDPHDNIMGGTRYFSKMLNKYQGNVNFALAAYNAGPGHVDEYHGIPPFKETQSYVPRVQNYASKFSSAHAL